MILLRKLSEILCELTDTGLYGTLTDTSSEKEKFATSLNWPFSASFIAAPILAIIIKKF